MAVMGHQGPLLPLYFAERILMIVHLPHLQLKHIDNYVDRTFIKKIQNNNSSHDLLDRNCCQKEQLSKFQMNLFSTFISAVSILKTSAL